MPDAQRELRQATRKIQERYETQSDVLPEFITLIPTKKSESDVIDILVSRAQEWGEKKLQKDHVSIWHAQDAVKDNPLRGCCHTHSFCASAFRL